MCIISSIFNKRNSARTTRVCGCSVCSAAVGARRPSQKVSPWRSAALPVSVWERSALNLDCWDCHHTKHTQGFSVRFPSDSCDLLLFYRKRPALRGYEQQVSVCPLSWLMFPWGMASGWNKTKISLKLITIKQLNIYIIKQRFQYSGRWQGDLNGLSAPSNWHIWFLQLYNKKNDNPKLCIYIHIIFFSFQNNKEMSKH